uniref:Uncharacterized protein n=1 Tax=Moniliophthora roreri TaxID=221103 RepID=A0A0W0GEF3_MONRR
MSQISNKILEPPLVILLSSCLCVCGDVQSVVWHDQSYCT